MEYEAAVQVLAIMDTRVEHGILPEKYTDKERIELRERIEHYEQENNINHE